ncbi:Enoyl- hydratase, mitochondrial [Lecanosticta acicola]|uniref:Enoyl- hydratase, mitochondrial n=1 Tax=Lecanosticta acicola TaxID=111012 RepID=A0AAI8Z8L5_9PEZI|nr:Enoyl- hydratase, mitochondrial [Lecanosticta acicola]
MTGNTSSPPPCDGVETSFPHPHILLLTLSRPKQMNSITHLMNWQIAALMDWYDAEPTLRCAVITGSGSKAFCAGSDLLEIESSREAKLQGLEITKAEPWLHEHPKGGFAGVSRRRGKKPLLCAVNGVALGGGFEIVLNSDIAIASPNAQFGLPEATVGVYAYGGGLPRLVRNLGMQAASDIALTGRRLSAKEALEMRLIQGIAKSSESVLEETLVKARQIAAISPDGIIVTRAALREAWETGSVERAFQITHDEYFDRLMMGENSAEGLSAFREKRKPKWRESKL